MADVWFIEAYERGVWVEKDRAYDERIVLTMFMGRASQMPGVRLRLKDGDDAILAERNVDKPPRH